MPWVPSSSTEGPRGPRPACFKDKRGGNWHERTKIDPILLSVYARTFKSITDEMSISMEQTTRSPILCEAKDYVTGLYDADGNMLEQTENLPILAFSLAPVCKYIKEFFGDEIYPGDVIFHNDVFSLGNQNNDVAAFKPVFFEDKLVAGRRSRATRPTSAAMSPAATTRTRSRSGRRRCASRRSRWSSAASCARTSGT
jgi:hypothetical protein